MSDDTKSNVESLQKAGRESATKKRDAHTKKMHRWMTPAAVVVFILSLPSWLPEWWKAQSEPEQASASAAAPTVAERPRVREQDDLGVKQTLVVGDIWSEPVFLPNNRCFRWWGENPDNDDAAYRIEVREAGGGSEWRSWKEFKELRSKKRVGHPAWARFSAVGETATVHYTFYDLRSSRCQGKG